MNKKETLRREHLLKRTVLSPLGVTEKSQKIARKLFTLVEIQGKMNFLIYVPINNEVDTKSIIEWLLGKGTNIFVPAHLKENNTWVFTKFTGWEELEKGPFNIPQPQSISPIDPATGNVAIIPGVAFSKKGVRLGYGKGVFDRLLGNSDAIKIGLAYDFQIVDEFTGEDHDLRMDIVITEKEILRF